MKVAIVVGNFPVLSQTFILNQIAGLIELGHEVDILSFGHGDTTKVHPIVEKYGLVSRTTYLWHPKHAWKHRFIHGDGVFWKLFFRSPSLALNAVNPFRFGRRALSLSLVYQAGYLKDRGPYDVVHCQFGTFGQDYLPLHELGVVGGKLVVQFRGYDISQFLREKGEHVYTRLFKKADHFLANCEFFKKRLIALGCPPEKMDVLYSGIDVGKFRYSERPAPPSGATRIALIGRLVGKKGVEYAVKAIALLRDRGLNAQLLLIGDGPLKKSLSDLGHKLGIADRVQFLGEMSQDEIVKVLETCHLFTAPSVTAENGDQDAPVNVLKEAMSMGLPVVATRHGGIPELVEDGISGLLVAEKDEKALADRLAYLIENPRTWAALAREGRKKVEDVFDMRKLNLELARIYERLAK